MEKELKKLSRRELVDIIYQMKKNEQQKQEEIAALEEALQEKRIRLSEAGSVAEAAAEITQIFSAAQKTADLYLQEIAAMKEDAEKECVAMLEDAQKKVDETLSEGKKQFAALNANYKRKYKKWEKLKAEIQKLEEKKAKE